MPCLQFGPGDGEVASFAFNYHHCYSVILTLNLSEAGPLELGRFVTVPHTPPPPLAEQEGDAQCVFEGTDPGAACGFHTTASCTSHEMQQRHLVQGIIAPSIPLTLSWFL